MKTEHMNLVMLLTSLRCAYLWVDGYERCTMANYRRTSGEIIFGVYRITGREDLP